MFPSLEERCLSRSERDSYPLTGNHTSDVRGGGSCEMRRSTVSTGWHWFRRRYEIETPLFFYFFFIRSNCIGVVISEYIILNIKGVNEWSISIIITNADTHTWMILLFDFHLNMIFFNFSATKTVAIAVTCMRQRGVTPTQLNVSIIAIILDVAIYLRVWIQISNNQKQT